MSGRVVGAGVLRRDGAAAGGYAGRAVVAGFPYLIAASIREDAGGRHFALTFRAEPIPPHLRIPGLDDDAPGPA